MGMFKLLVFIRRGESMPILNEVFFMTQSCDFSMNLMQDYVVESVSSFKLFSVVTLAIFAGN